MMGVFSPVTELKSMIEEDAGFQMEIDGEVRKFGDFKLPDLKSGKIVEVQKWDIREWSHNNQKKKWTIRVLLNGLPTDLKLEPRHLLQSARIVFMYSLLDDGSKLVVAGCLPETSVHCAIQLRGLGFLLRRHRKYKKSEQKFGLQVILQEVPLESERKRDLKVPKHETFGGKVDNGDDASKEQTFEKERKREVRAVDRASLENDKPRVIGGGRNVAVRDSGNDVLLQSKIRQWRRPALRKNTRYLQKNYVNEDAEEWKPQPLWLLLLSFSIVFFLHLLLEKFVRR